MYYMGGGGGWASLWLDRGIWLQQYTTFQWLLYSVLGVLLLLGAASPVRGIPQEADAERARQAVSPATAVTAGADDSFDAVTPPPASTASKPARGSALKKTKKKTL